LCARGELNARDNAKRIEVTFGTHDLTTPSQLRVAVVAIAALMVGGCTSARWVAITDATARDPSSTSFTINIDSCANVPDPRVVETDTEVHLLVDLRLDSDTKACLSGAIVHLAQPIGKRIVIDDRRHQVVPMTWSPVALP
jgi:hypothetical protein